MIKILPHHRPLFTIKEPLKCPSDPVLAIRNATNVISDDFAFCLCIVFSDSYLYLEGPASGQLWHLGDNKHEDFFYEIECKGAYITTSDGCTNPSGALFLSVGVLPLRPNDNEPATAA